MTLGPKILEWTVSLARSFRAFNAHECAVFLHHQLLHCFAISVTANDVTVNIDGLDEEGKLVVNPGESSELKAMAKGRPTLNIYIFLLKIKES